MYIDYDKANEIVLRLIEIGAPQGPHDLGKKMGAVAYVYAHIEQWKFWNPDITSGDLVDIATAYLDWRLNSHWSEKPPEWMRK